MKERSFPDSFLNSEQIKQTFEKVGLRLVNFFTGGQNGGKNMGAQQSSNSHAGILTTLTISLLYFLPLETVSSKNRRQKEVESSPHFDNGSHEINKFKKNHD